MRNPPHTHQRRKISLEEKPKSEIEILNGFRAISSVNVGISSSEEPILAEILRKMLTEAIEKNVNIHD